MTYYQCECGWEGREDEIVSVCVFNQTRYEPAEYESYCPDCNGSWDDMTEITTGVHTMSNQGLKTCVGRYDGASQVRQVFMLMKACQPFARKRIHTVYDLTVTDFHTDAGRDQFDAFEEAIHFASDVMKQHGGIFEYPDWSHRTVAALRRHVTRLIMNAEQGDEL